MKESSELPEPIFTPATKAETGHDENIPFTAADKIVGADIAEEARAKSLKIYNSARDYARKRGIIIADTKFEFGLFNGKLILIDEVLTPDSSRFWPADQYQPGQGPAELRQAIRPRLPGNTRLEQDPARPGVAAGSRCQNQRDLSGGLRAVDGEEIIGADVRRRFLLENVHPFPGDAHPAAHHGPGIVHLPVPAQARFF